MTIALIAMLAVIVLLAVIARRPSAFSVTRAAAITAPPAAIFPYINNLHNWQTWSPWAKMDPKAITTFEGPAEGVGAKMSWVGTKTGTGSMTIIDSQPGALVQFRLEFLKPFKGTNSAEFTFTPEGDQTRVTWSMTGYNNFMSKAFGLFMDCEKMVATQFDNGLADLKQLVEARA